MQKTEVAKQNLTRIYKNAEQTFSQNILMWYEHISSSHRKVSSKEHPPAQLHLPL